MRRLAAPLALAVALAAPAPAAGYDTADLQHKLAREMRRAGPQAGAYVRDLDSGRELFALRADRALVPASVEKLYTTSTALLRLGPSATLDTAAVTDGGVDAGGVLRGNLVLVGGGDPFFGARGAALLARAVHGAGITRVDGSVVGDESYFDSRRSGLYAGYDVDLGGVLSALAYDGGLVGGRAQLDAGRFAAGRFAAQLRRIGVRATTTTRAGRAPFGARSVATSSSLDVAQLIRYVNVPSNNFAAEMLLKVLGARFGAGGSTAAGAAVVRATLDGFGIRPRIFDGSGLSRSDRTTAREVVRLLERIDGQPVASAFRASLASAGRTGTVRRRMRGTAAQGRCRVKTGTLRGVSALAGYCRTRGGHDVAFAWLMNGVSPFGARPIQDRMTAAIARLDTDSGGAVPGAPGTTTTPPGTTTTTPGTTTTTPPSGATPAPPAPGG